MRNKTSNNRLLTAYFKRETRYALTDVEVKSRMSSRRFILDEFDPNDLKLVN